MIERLFPPASYPWLPGWYHLAFAGVVLPALAVLGHRKLAKKELPLPDRTRHFRSTTFTLALFMGVSLWVARAQRIELFPFDRDHLLPGLLPGLLAGLAMYVAAVLFMRPRWRRAVERRARVVYLFMPDNARERAWWIAVSVLAGVGEEITWRGAQTSLLFGWIGNYWVAAVLCAVCFGLAHYVQGWRSAAVIVFFALGFQLVVLVSGSLYIAMLVHVVYDVTAGLAYGRLGRELGYRLDPALPAVEPAAPGPVST